MANYMGFTTDKANVYVFILDASGSMQGEERSVIDGLNGFIKSFENFPEVSSISVSVCQFANGFSGTHFSQVKDIDVRYRPKGGTALFYSICKGAEHLKRYREEIEKRKNISPRCTFVVFSDGEDNRSESHERKAMQAIKELNDDGVDTIFVAFGHAIYSRFGDAMGFVCTKDEGKENMEKFFAQELSKSCKEQSLSMKSLGANFFSQNNKSTASNNFSQASFQAVNNDTFFDDI